jgi:hypothetical protein
VPKLRLYVWSFLFLALISAPVSAQTVTVTSGNASPWWDGSLSGLQLSGAGTQLIGEFYNGTVSYGFTPGTRANLDGAISLNPNSSNHTFQETVNGTTYSSVWITAQLTFTTQPMLIPSAPEGATTVFSTPFTVTGQFSGYADRNLTQQVFSVAVQGSGVASSLTMRMMSGSWVAFHSGAQNYGFTGPLPAPWTATDVGAVGVSGVSSWSNNVFEVAGAGSDIWGTTDAFQFVSQRLAADGSIIARVQYEQDPSPYAKAGVMIRQTVGPSAPDVILDVRPGGIIEFMTRSAGGANTTFLASATVTSPPWLKLARSGSTVTASVSTDGTSWSSLGTATFAGSGLIGLAVTSHDSTILNQAGFDQVAVAASTDGGGGALPIGWSHADVGAVGMAGDATYSGGTFNVTGAGADIWGTADAFHYAYTPMNSDGFIEARVTNENNTSAFAKAGIMFRDSLDPGSTQAILDVKPDGFVEFMTRSTAGGSTSYVTGIQASFPVSLKLRRGYAKAVSIITAFVLDTSGTWQQIGWVYLPLSPSATAGLAVTSHDTSVVNTGIFDTVEVQKNLIANPSFEGYTPPAMVPEWVSDQPLRAITAVTDTHPHNGYQNGACIQTTYQDCGMYQEVVAPATAAYTLTMFANSDRSGGLVGANVDGQNAQSSDVPVTDAPGNYRELTLHFNAVAGTKIRVWMYSPASPGAVRIDDVSLTQDFND